MTRRNGAVLDSAESSLYNARHFACPASPAGPAAQVAQLVEHVTENHGVGGSIPPLGTKTPALTDLQSRSQKLTPCEKHG